MTASDKQGIEDFSLLLDFFAECCELPSDVKKRTYTRLIQYISNDDQDRSLEQALGISGVNNGRKAKTKIAQESRNYWLYKAFCLIDEGDHRKKIKIFTKEVKSFLIRKHTYTENLSEIRRCLLKAQSFKVIPAPKRLGDIINIMHSSTLESTSPKWIDYNAN